MVGRPALPPPRRPGAPYRVAVVCLGNICRSPMAHVVLAHELADAGLERRVEVVSGGTGGWHLGDPMDRRAAAALTARSYDPGDHQVRQFVSDWYDECDLVLAMDAANLADLADLLLDEHERERLRMFRDFDPRSAGEHDRDVPDPYFGGDEGFDSVLATLERTSRALVDVLRELLDRDPAAPRAGG